jgi:hypothetical protein
MLRLIVPYRLRGLPKASRIPASCFVLVMAAGPNVVADVSYVRPAMAAAIAEPAKVAGVWKFTVELAVGTGHPTVTLKQDGEKLTGTYEGRYGPSALEGTIKENKIEFTVSMTAEGAAVSGVFSGVVEGEGMHGAVDFDQAGEGTWTAVKSPPK